MSRSQSWQRAAVLILVVLFVSFACKKNTPASPPPPTPVVATPPQPAPPCTPPTIALRADAVTIPRGNSITLSWTANNAAAVDIQPGIGPVTPPGTGSRQVSPASSVTYTATATSPCNSAADTLRVTVNDPPPAPPPAVPPAAPPAPPTVTSVPLDTLFNQNMQAILFDYDKADIRDSETAKLQKATAFLKSNPSVRLTVEGHCDERGSEQYNQALGERRANVVKQFLLSQGIADTRISTISYGEERPVCTDQSEDCFAKNRRAAFARN